MVGWTWMNAGSYYKINRLISFEKLGGSRTLGKRWPSRLDDSEQPTLPILVLLAEVQ
jgi:hypothetical protein